MTDEHKWHARPASVSLAAVLSAVMTVGLFVLGYWLNGLATDYTRLEQADVSLMARIEKETARVETIVNAKVPPLHDKLTTTEVRLAGYVADLEAVREDVAEIKRGQEKIDENLDDVKGLIIQQQNQRPYSPPPTWPYPPPQDPGR